jgi:hypothetical protein
MRKVILHNYFKTHDAPVELSTIKALAKAQELDPLKYWKGIKSIVRAPDTDNWNAHYDFEKDQILFQAKFEKKTFQDKVLTILHELGHRGQSVDSKTYKAFCDQGLGSVKNFLAMCNTTHREDYEKNGVDNPDEEAFAESYARFALGMPMPEAIKAFWTKRIGS